MAKKEGPYTGRRIGDYDTGYMIGEGQFGQVYEVTKRDKQFAMKLGIQNRKFGGGVPDGTTTRSDINAREAMIMQTLSKHTNIMTIHHFGDVMLDRHHVPYMVMDLAPYGSMEDYCPIGTKLSLAQVSNYVGQIASALQYAHDKAIVHHDVKPANLLLGRNREILLSDFGVAEESHYTRRGGSEIIWNAGTPSYMPPEQLSQGYSHKSGDQYALALITYQWLTGYFPFKSNQMKRAGNAQAISSLASVRPRVDQIVARAMAVDEGERYPNVRDFANILAGEITPWSTP